MEWCWGWCWSGVGLLFASASSHLTPRGAIPFWGGVVTQNKILEESARRVPTPWQVGPFWFNAEAGQVQRQRGDSEGTATRHFGGVLIDLRGEERHSAVESGAEQHRAFRVQCSTVQGSAVEAPSRYIEPSSASTTSATILKERGMPSGSSTCGVEWVRHVDRTCVSWI